MKQYLSALQLILDKGFDSKPARENMPPTKVHNDVRMRFDLKNGQLPIITTKQMPPRSIIAELLCFMAGVTDVQKYDAMGCGVWWDNAYKWNVPKHFRTSYSIENYKADANGNSAYSYDLGRIYAAQWRDHMGIHTNGDVAYTDQLADIIYSITNELESRYHVMDSWNPAEMNKGDVSQPNCHVYFQVTCRELDEDERTTMFGEMVVNSPEAIRLELIDKGVKGCNIPKYAIRTSLTQRSCDMFLGVPFNITSYAMLTHILAKITNTMAEEFVWNGVNCHIYGNHMEQVKEQLKRTPLDIPTVKLHDDIKSLVAIEDLVLQPKQFKEDFKLLFNIQNYKHHPKLSGKLSVGL